MWLDSADHLHLKISHRGGKWSCAEITMQKRLGFGRYEFQTTGWLDRLDDNVVLGLFNYPTTDVGPDGTHEIDIEFARWGEARNPLGNFTVWPVERELKQVSKAFPVVLTGGEATHRFTWSVSPKWVFFRQGFRDLLPQPESVTRKLGNLVAPAARAALAPLLETLPPR